MLVSADAGIGSEVLVSGSKVEMAIWVNSSLMEDKLFLTKVKQ